MPAELKMFRVTSHQFRYASEQRGERWFDSYEAAQHDVKQRLGEERFHPDARRTESDTAHVEVQHEGMTWKRVWSCRYSEMPQSSGKQDQFGYVLVEEMRRPSPPFVNPFQNKQS